MDKELYEKLVVLLLSPDESNYQLAAMLYRAVYPNSSDKVMESYFKFILSLNKK